MRLNNKIRFIEEGTVSDGAGGYEPTVITVLETWAHIEPLRTSADIEQASKDLPLILRVRIRDREGFYPTKGNAIVWNLKEYQIISSPEPDTINRTRYLIFDIK